MGLEAAAGVADEEEDGEGRVAEGRVPHPEDGMGMDEEPDWHVALENGTVAKLPLNQEGSTYVLDNDGVTVGQLWESLDLSQLREVSPPPPLRHSPLPRAILLAARVLAAPPGPAALHTCQAISRAKQAPGATEA